MSSEELPELRICSHCRKARWEHSPFEWETCRNEDTPKDRYNPPRVIRPAGEPPPIAPTPDQVLRGLESVKWLVLRNKVALVPAIDTISRLYAKQLQNEMIQSLEKADNPRRFDFGRPWTVAATSDAVEEMFTQAIAAHKSKHSETPAPVRQPFWKTLLTRIRSWLLK